MIKMHFLKKITESPILKDPAVEHLDVHRHFYRYSKGEFIGPALKLTKTNTRITLKGSHEYEDVILEAVANTISQDEFEIKGVLISGSDVSNLITDLGFNWTMKKSSGKTKNYKASVLGKTTRDTFLESIEAFRKTSYYLISFNISPTCKVTTKKNIPQPSKKKVEEDDINKRIQFCTGIMNNTEQNLKKTLDLVLSDFKSELPEKWKNIIISNNYKISGIELPDDIDNWGLKRILAIRKAKLFRSVDIDGEIIEKQYNIVV